MMAAFTPPMAAVAAPALIKTAPPFLGNLGGMPSGICIDKNGKCIVANIDDGQVQLLAPDGNHVVLMTYAEDKECRARISRLSIPRATGRCQFHKYG